VSGGFDPIHVGHIRLFKEAKKFGDKLIVFVNSDKFLKDKKGYVFMSLKERIEIIEAIKVVDLAVKVIDKDESVCETLKIHKPYLFANGGDRKANNIPEYDICEELGIKMKFGVGGSKVQSSSNLIKKINIL
jgi:D-beta-D-heptose 7-phosphate kinase/D-beta-D-heptose 1-phosphate adenosyltransferase